MPHHYCTYFDVNYLPRALALIRSMQRHCGEFVLWALCFDDASHAALTRLAPANVRLIRRADFLDGDAALQAAQHDRTPVEFIMTCTPALLRYVMQLDDAVDALTYLDADTYFFADPEPVFLEIGAAPVAITPHFFAEGKANHLCYGRYNVGWLTFRRDAEGLACIDWWRAECLKWCRLSPDGPSYGDQGYLDQFTRRFPHTHEIAHAGLNVGPWNLWRLNEARAKGDGPAVLVHFQGIYEVFPGWVHIDIGGFRFEMTPFVRHVLYRAYFKALRRAGAELGAPIGMAGMPVCTSLRPGAGFDLRRGLVELRRLIGDVVRGHVMAA